MPENPIKFPIFWPNSGPSGIYSSLKDPLTLGGGVCSTPPSLGGGMCSTSLSSGLLQSHVSSLSLPSVCSVSNTQVAVSKHHRFLSVLRTTRTKLCVGCLTGSSGFQLCLQPDLHSAFCQLSLLCTHAGTDTEPSPDLTARWEKIHRAAVALKRVGGVHHCLVLFSEPDLDDCRFPCQGNSPRESLSSQYASFLLSRKPVDAKFDMSAPPGPLE